MLVDNRRKNKWTMHLKEEATTLSPLYWELDPGSLHIVAHMLITTSFLVKDGHRRRIDPTTMQRETN